MRVSIRKTLVAAVAALGMATAVATISTPAEAQFHGGGGFHGGGFHGGGGFTGAAGEAAAGMAAAGAAVVGAAAGAGPDGAAAGVIGARAGAGAEVGAAAVGIAAGVGAAAGAGAMTRAGRSRRRPCRSGSRSLRSRLMAADPVAGSGGASGRRTATIWAGGLSTFATDRRRAMSSADMGRDKGFGNYEA